jgi:hypothetical protein
VVSQSRDRIAIALEAASSVSYSIALDIKSALEDYDVDLPSLTAGGGRLEDEVVPRFEGSDVVIVVWSTTDPIWSAFQAGLADGLAKPVLNLAYDPAALPVAEAAKVDVQLIENYSDLGAEVRAVSRSVSPRPYKPGSVLLCPDETSNDRDAVERLRKRLPHRMYRSSRSRRSTVSNDVLWVITPYAMNARSGRWSNLEPNVRAAYEAGRHYGGTVQAGHDPKLTIARLGSGPPLLPLEHLVVANAETAAELASLLTPGPNDEVLRLVQLELVDVKCFDKIVVPLSVESALGGAWTCIAGVNGAGKSTILQSIALAMLGRRRCVELGLGRLGRMVRRTDKVKLTKGETTEIRLTVQFGADETVLRLPLDPSGPDERRLISQPDLLKMDRLWMRFDDILVVSYGATRNLTDSPATPQDRSPMAQRQLTLFDPLAQIASSEALTVGGLRFKPALRTLAKLLSAVLSEPGAPFDCSVDESGQLRFQRDGATLESLDLPDGFRSMVALLADISHGWHDLHPDQDDPELDKISGIVLVDELDLHLHAQLQRRIVGQLRAALPHVQWIVTTHSPLVVTSFESSELVVLDREAEGGIRQLDREVLAFTANEVYDWLLDTRPVSTAGVAEMAADRGSELLYQSPTLDAAQAKQLADMQGDLLAKLASQAKA